MRNFDYIKDLGLTELYRFCSIAEEQQVTNPDISAVNARRALEYIVRSLYEMKNIDIPERTSLFELVDGEPFKEFIGDDRVMMAVHYVRKVGNNAAHASSVSKKESFFCLLNIYNLVSSVIVSHWDDCRSLWNCWNQSLVKWLYVIDNPKFYENGSDYIVDVEQAEERLLLAYR